MIECRIKELSIALEALSRIAQANGEYNEVQSLLSDLLTQARKEYRQTKPSNERPDDEIPF